MEIGFRCGRVILTVATETFGILEILLPTQAFMGPRGRFVLDERRERESAFVW